LNEEAQIEGLSKFAQRIGISFNDPDLLRLALTHASFPNENGSSPLDSNERLEFLGDALVGLFVAEYLFEKMPETREGELTVRRSHAVRGEALAVAARRIGIGDYLILGNGERNAGGYDRASNLAGAFEALVGAIALDAGEDEARKFVLRVLAEEISAAMDPAAGKDPKSLLQEYLQARAIALPEYAVVEETGPEKEKLWRMEVLIEGESVATGEGRRKVDAERQAAEVALTALTGDDSKS
jgi:ribonuclease-3